MKDWYGIMFLAIYPASAVLGIFIGRLIWRYAELKALKQLDNENMARSQRTLKFRDTEK